jgi:uncharacterized protein
MNVVNRTRNALLADRVLTARTALARTRGLLGTFRLLPGEGLWILPCRGIHSIGMRYEIDALFLDRNRQVVAEYRRFRRNRISRIFWRAMGVLELPAGTLERTETRIGDEIEFRPAAGWAA